MSNAWSHETVYTEKCAENLINLIQYHIEKGIRWWEWSGVNLVYN